MRILLVAGSYPPDLCGVADYIFRLESTLKSFENITIGVIVTKNNFRKEDHLTNFLIEVEGWYWSELGRIKNAIKEWQPDIIHIQYPTQGFFNQRMPELLPLIFRVLGFKTVITLHEPPPNKYRTQLLSLLPILGSIGIIYVRPNLKDYYFPSIWKVLGNRKTALIFNSAAISKANLSEVHAADIKTELLNGRKRLIVFFGFIYRNKGLEDILEVMNPEVDQVIFIGSIGDMSYVDQLKLMAKNKGVDKYINFTGFLDKQIVESYLAVADVVILPFKDGGGIWNSSIHSAVIQGTFVITTSLSNLGYDVVNNIYFVRPGDLVKIKYAICQYSGTKVTPKDDAIIWQGIGRDHLSFFNYLLSSGY